MIFNENFYRSILRKRNNVCLRESNFIPRSIVTVLFFAAWSNCLQALNDNVWFWFNVTFDLTGILHPLLMKLSKRVGLFNGQTATGNDLTNEWDHGVIQSWGPPFKNFLPHTSVSPLVPSKILRPPNFFFQHLTRPQGTIWNTPWNKPPNLLDESPEVSESQVIVFLENVVSTKQLTGRLQLVPRDIEILRWCPVGSVLSHGEVSR